jgi:catechol 2,3-dioxygenase-like lactoylglutathione lyase family enzyme
MSQHHIAAILPCADLARSRAFYERLGLSVVSDHGHYLLMSDGKGWHLHLRAEDMAALQAPHNPFGLYIYVDDVDGVADRMRELIIEPGTPHLRPWGTYEFAVSDPDGVLVRIGRVPRGE